ncbi:MAG: hypothetical protein KAU28_08415 [Phycisphaerae bacterium]|nr:hypothetical protein [Phycisphaerae bacterium]
MNEVAIKKKLAALAEEIRTVPISKKASKVPSEGIYLPEASSGDLSMEQSLDNLQLQVKYLLFDLEATRRENRYLMQMLENRPRPGGGADGNS